jgi:hypothetical protein
MMTGDISPVPWWNRMPFTAWIPKVKPWWVRRMTAPIGLLAVLGAPACEGRRKVRWTRSLRIGSGPVGVLAFSSHLLVVAAGDDQSVQVIRLNTRHRIGRSWSLIDPSFGHPHGLTLTRDGALWVSCDTPAIVRFPPEWRSKTVPATATLR